ncbi:hypothetical protein [Pseudomonas sp. RL_15y_Pfl2_60]|uniref:hypothetical protein n=1 Tax=Pseudomonas sp. RL_15y_Pfl2_60 TaxID=3088709 RepID=UPI0030D9FD9A
MDLLRAIGFCFLGVVVPLGALLASNPSGIAQWLSGMLGTDVTRASLGIGFLALAAICLKIDLTIRRRAQAAKARLA